jgi:regulator of PEP synthase PpsR (kinase-PPPase family)
MSERTVFVVSDRTGITAETLSHSLLSQFPSIRFRTIAIPFVDTVDKARAAVGQIQHVAERDGEQPLVFSTFVDEQIHDIVRECGGVFFDFFDAFIGPLERVLGQISSHTMGRTHGVVDVDRYSSRISAVDFSMHCDDGINTVDYNAADLILTGVSRSGKTPTCLYLALHYGLRAANYPLVEDDLERDQLPDSLREFRDKLFALTIEPERLQQIRQERRPNSSYSKLARCRMELTAAEEIFRRESVPCIDVTSMSIEEISATILDRMGLHRDPF